MEKKDKYDKQDIVKMLKGLPDSGNVEVRFINPKKTGTVTLRDYTLTDENGATDYRPFIDSNGNRKVSKYTKKRVLRMENDNDRLEYGHLLHHPLYLSGATAIFKLFNFEDEAKSYVALKDAEAKANAKINEYSGQELRDLARVVQVRVRPGSSETVLKRALYEYSDSKDDSSGATGAVDIIKQLESPDYDSKVLLFHSMDKKYVTVTGGKYLFNQTGLGMSFDSALQYLIDNPDVESELKKKFDFKTA